MPPTARPRPMAQPGLAGELLPDISELLHEWARRPGAHPILGDWRRAGHRRGADLPADPAGPVVPAADHGILPDTGQDTSVALQRALDDLGAGGGGVLLLSEGRYVLDRPLFIHDSHTVLRGAGTDGTTLFFTRPLAESLGPVIEEDGGQSAWSWTGGQVFLISRERLAASGEAGWDITRATEGWLPGPVQAAVSPASRGTQILLVDSTASITSGAMALLEVDNLPDRALLREMTGGVPGADTYEWGRRAARITAPAGLADYRSWRWPLVVTEVLNSRAVRTEQPLRLTIAPGIPARLRALGATVHDSGVENLTIENRLLAQTRHNRHPGSNGVCFQAVHDCWARDVRVVNADCAYVLTSAKSCTLSGISYRGRALHHFVACRAQSHDNLVEDFLLEEFTIAPDPGSVVHGINLEGFSSGNVYRRGAMRAGTFDSHRQLPFENLRTDITLYNTGHAGGAADAGPRYGARTVNWGVTVTNGRNQNIDVSDSAPCSVTAGIVGLARPGSGEEGEFGSDLGSLRLAFGTELGAARDLLDLQRGIAPPHQPRS
ncbi:hypothetical protein ACIQAC_34415 [Streptomyces sp. NPDC088387]|uniref:hypothetical protein n=1 Tax=Streptomyces sp. NPDC088387 TaxID=3365859 RepID=UPI00380CFB54